MSVETGDFIRVNNTYGIVKLITDNSIIDHLGNVYDLDENVPFIIKYNKDDTKKDLILKGLRATLDQYSFRVQGTLSTRPGYSGEPFFFGFTGKADMYHQEIATLNHPEVYPTVIYYQAGNYADLLLEDGIFEFGDIYDRKKNFAIGTFIMGIIQRNDNKIKFSKWIYANDQLYRLYILIMYGDTYYMFRGMSKQDIINSLEMKNKSETKNVHYYQAFALVCYYGDDIPPEYDLVGLKEKIIEYYSWIEELHDLNKIDNVFEFTNTQDTRDESNNALQSDSFS